MDILAESLISEVEEVLEGIQKIAREALFGDGHLGVKDTALNDIAVRIQEQLDEIHKFNFGEN